MNQKHNYYYQIQGQLHITKRKWCDFVIYVPNEVHIKRVYRHDYFLKDKMFPFLGNFYFTCIVPEIVDSRQKRNMELREPEKILKALEKKEKMKKEKKEKAIKILSSNAIKKKARKISIKKINQLLISINNWYHTVVQKRFNYPNQDFWMNFDNIYVANKLIDKRCLQTLLPNKWISDVVIESFSDIVAHENPQESIMIFSPFFMEVITIPAISHSLLN